MDTCGQQSRDNDSKNADLSLERWPSGLRQRFAKPSQGINLYRGFESRPLRYSLTGKDLRLPETRPFHWRFKNSIANCAVNIILAHRWQRINSDSLLFHQNTLSNFSRISSWNNRKIFRPFLLFFVHLPKIGNGFMIRFQSTREPQEGQIVIDFSFQFTTAADAVGISINQQFEHHFRIILRTANFVRIHFDA